MALGKDDLLIKLRELEFRLGAADVEDLMIEQDEITRKDFIKQREQVSIVIGKLENAQLSDIADQLDRLGPQLNEGIGKMHHELGAINNAIAIVNTVSTVLTLAARVAAA